MPSRIVTQGATLLVGAAAGAIVLHLQNPTPESNQATASAAEVEARALAPEHFSPNEVLAIPITALEPVIPATAPSDSGLAERLVELGEALALTGMRDLSAEAFLIAIDADPRSARPHYYLATMCREGGEYAQAERHLDQCIELEPGSALATKAQGDLAGLPELVARAATDEGARALEYERKLSHLVELSTLISAMESAMATIMPTVIDVAPQQDQARLQQVFAGLLDSSKATAGSRSVDAKPTEGPSLAETIQWLDGSVADTEVFKELDDGWTRLTVLGLDDHELLIEEKNAYLSSDMDNFSVFRLSYRYQLQDLSPDITLESVPGHDGPTAVEEGDGATRIVVSTSSGAQLIEYTQSDGVALYHFKHENSEDSYECVAGDKTIDELTDPEFHERMYHYHLGESGPFEPSEKTMVNKMEFLIADPVLAGRVAKALRHAIEASGGRKSPF